MPTHHTLPHVMLGAGLVLLGLSFTALDRGWWTIDPLGPVQHPVAAAIGACGLAIFSSGMLWRKRGHR